MTEEELLVSLKTNMEVMKKLQLVCDDPWIKEDLIYRFYHNSFKVYKLQSYTSKIVDTLRSLNPGCKKLNQFFEDIIKEGTGRAFEYSHNREWTKWTRPILEAYFHARYMLDMAVKYGQELEAPPSILPSGWASFLYLYNMR